MGASVHHPRQAPMEFNHAINYVNKIKMRFAAEPDHYKEFLEILQTYQKESRPIQEVYSQVQVLFASAPDLLDEFKQFLPDTSESGGPGAGGGMIGGHGSAASPAAGHARSGSSLLQGQQGVAGRAGGDAVASSRLPPVGNFTPTGAVGHVVDPYAQAGGVASSATAGGAAASGTGRKRRNVMGSGNAQVPGATASKRRNKGSKHESNALPVPMGDAAAAGLYGQAMPDAAMIQMPQNPATATSDELVFFERVKRFIGQPATYNEFLKLLNMYNQEVLDAKGLMDRAASFIGDDRELMAWFKQFVGYDERQQSVEDSRSSDEAIMESLLGPEPQAYLTPEDAAKTLRPVRQKADLTNCKSYGPSYRLLPPSATQAKCSGRDAMCYEVLNDKWASHPTWASEDTDFMHHKKNCYEDGLFRTEEDRHEMDIEIDTNLSVIRQLTPIAQQIEKMDPEQAMQLTLPENFWGMSEALPRRALRKVYDSHRALEIIKAMHTHPSVAIPIVLKRLKQKDEEWRRQRRECSKAWRESDAKNFYKALDHQGLTFKSTDRKNISPKHLVQEIETRRREQQNLADEGGARAQSRKVASALRHRYQLEYKFTEPTVIADVINAILAHVGKPNSQFVASEKESMEKLFQELFDGLLGVEKSADDSSAEKQQQQQNPSSAVTNGVSSPSPSPGADSGKANGKGGDKGSDSDGVAMDVD
ncbi:Transcriptional regulatory protein sin3, partial [Linderina pennispora]